MIDHTKTRDKYFDPNLLSELIDQSHNPPGADIVLGNFYAALVEMIEEKGEIAAILMKIKKARQDITYKHLVNLIFRVYQAIKLRQNDLSYRSYDSINKWRKELELIVKDKKNRRDFERLLLTKTTTTTIYQRYVGPVAIIAKLMDGKNVTIADLGCGGNYGLRGIELKEPFKDIRDLTPRGQVEKYVGKRINLQKGLAIDKENPDEESTRNWRLACSFYPKELDEIRSVSDFEKRIRSNNKVEFLQSNLLTSKRLPQIRVDVVILSSILYQLNLLDQLTLIEKAKRLLKRGGIIIVQDFAVKNMANPHHLDFNESWFGKKYSYRTFIVGAKTGWKFLEILQWNNGRCRIVSPGEDFDKIFTLSHNYPKAPRAAFAHSTS